MSKRRNNKNKGQNAGKGGKQAKLATPVGPAVVETSDFEPTHEQAGEDLSAMLVTSEAADESGSDLEQATSDAQSLDSGDGSAEPASGDQAVAGAEAFADEPQVVEAFAEEIPAYELVATGEESPDSGTAESAEPEQARKPLDVFEDASAALARAIQVDPTEAVETTQLQSIPIFDRSVMGFEEGGQASPTWDSMLAQSNEAVPSDAPDAAANETSESGSGNKGKKDRKLRLNKLQKHARGAPMPEPEEIAPEPEPEPVPRAPREPRIQAFAKLTEYQNLSLVHVPGLPEESDVPGHWRGVGFGIGGRRLVSAFDEVVEIMRLPQITHVPGTQPWMLGVANVRGTLLPVVDLKQFLEGERTVMHEGQRVLVVRQAGGNVAVLIDQLFGQRSFNDSQKAAAVSDTSRYGFFIKQMYRVGDNDWGVFSMSMLTRTPEFRQAAA